MKGSEKIVPVGPSPYQEVMQILREMQERSHLEEPFCASCDTKDCDNCRRYDNSLQHLLEIE